MGYTVSLAQQQAAILSRTPMSPVLDWRYFRLPARAGCDSILDNVAVDYFASGRLAIAAALQAVGLEEGDEVLLPAYHCPAMAEPVAWLGGRAEYFYIHADTSPDIVDIKNKLSPRTRAILVAHYFGFPQDFSALRKLCDEHSIFLIEDCAHCLFTAGGAGSVGSFGDLVVVSPRKILPLMDGGALLRNSASPASPSPRSLGVAYNVKLFLDTLETAARYRRLRGLVKPLALLSSIKSLRSIKSRRSEAPAARSDVVITADDTQEQAQPYHDRRFTSASLGGKMSGVSRVLLHIAALPEVLERRREIFSIYAQAFADLRNGHPLYAMPAGCVAPYVFPLVVNDPHTRHAELKRRGVPMFRWDTLNTDICSVSNDYRYSVLQLPCHQALRPAELAAIIAVVMEVVG